MTRRKRHHRFLPLGLLTVLLYLSSGPGTLTVPLNIWMTGQAGAAGCGCDGSAACCGAVCCSPRIPSCCESPATADVPVQVSTGDDDLVWMTACTCGQGSRGTHVQSGGLSPHFPTTIPAPRLGSGYDRLICASAAGWRSLAPDPPDRIPRLL